MLVIQGTNVNVSPKQSRLSEPNAYLYKPDAFHTDTIGRVMRMKRALKNLDNNSLHMHIRVLRIATVVLPMAAPIVIVNHQWKQCHLTVQSVKITA